MSGLIISHSGRDGMIAFNHIFYPYLMPDGILNISKLTNSDVILKMKIPPGNELLRPLPAG